MGKDFGCGETTAQPASECHAEVADEAVGDEHKDGGDKGKFSR